MAKKQIKHTATQLDKMLNAAFPAEGSPSMTDSEKAQLQQTIGVTDLAAKVGEKGSVSTLSLILQSGYIGADGNEGSLNSRVRTDYIDATNCNVTIITSGDIVMRTANKYTSQSISGHIAQIFSSDSSNYTFPKGYYYRVTFRNTSNSAITTDDVRDNVSATKSTDNSGLFKDVNDLTFDVNGVNKELTASGVCKHFKGKNANIYAQLGKLISGDNAIVNIGFIGDSYTQGVTENEVAETYSRYLCKKLQEKYGFAGLGWLDLSEGGGLFGCCDLDGLTYSKSGTITYIDGSTAAEAPIALGLACAHPIMGNGSTITLTIPSGKCDKIVLWIYKGSVIRVARNGQAGTDYEASGDDNWQSFVITPNAGTTEITKIVLMSKKDGSVILGLDCFYGNKGVRCHKIGNRGITIANFLKEDESQWKEGISKLNLCWASFLFGINDLNDGTPSNDSGYTKVVNNLDTFVNRLMDVYGYDCDINVISPYDIVDTRWTGLPSLSERQRLYAIEKGFGYDSTEMFGNKEQITRLGIFMSDNIHLKNNGCAALAEHLFNDFFKL